MESCLIMHKLFLVIYRFQWITALHIYCTVLQLYILVYIDFPPIIALMETRVLESKCYLKQVR